MLKRDYAEFEDSVHDSWYKIREDEKVSGSFITVAFFVYFLLERVL